MKNIKTLLNNVVFKIFIGFLILSFAFLGVSSFILGGNGSYVAKVGNKKISYSTLQKSMEINKNIILSNYKDNKQALAYLNSKEFVNDSLNRILSQVMVEKLGQKYGVKGDRKLIMEMIAKDATFRRNGKFDYDYFKYFLAQNGLDEDNYIKSIQNEIVNVMVANSISIASISDVFMAQKFAELDSEKRVADIVILKNISGEIKSPQEVDLKALYDENKESFKILEMRKISYIKFKKTDILPKILITENEAKSYYEANKENFKQDEKRDFYHIIFKEEKQAKNFLKKLEKSGDKTKDFVVFANEIGKNIKSIEINNVDKKNILPDLANQAFSLKKNEVSKILKSDLGFHIFLTRDIKDNLYFSYQNVEKEIKKELLAKNQKKLFEEKISAINNYLTSSNSLAKTAEKFALGRVFDLEKIDKNSLENNDKNLQNFARNIFLLKQNQTSQLYEDDNFYYAFFVKEIQKESYKNFEETKYLLTKFYYDKKRNEMLKNKARELADEIAKNSKMAREIAYKFGANFVANQEFSRFEIIKFQGKSIPYSNSLNDELFQLELGKSTSYHDNGNLEFRIAILKNIKKNSVKKEVVDLYRKQLQEIYRSENLEEFNNYLQKDFKVEINEKFLKSLEEQNNNGL